MQEQMKINFPEVPKQPILSKEELMIEAQQKYGVLKPLINKGPGNWYVRDFDGTLIHVEEYKRRDDKMSRLEEGQRADFN